MGKNLWIQIVSYRPNCDAPSNRAYSFAKHFSSKGYNVFIITNGIENIVEKHTNIRVFRIKNKFHYLKKTIFNRLLDNLVFLKGSKKIIKDNKNDILNSYYIASSPELISSLAGVFAKKSGAKLIFDVRDIWPEVAIEMNTFNSKSLFAFVFRKIANYLYKKSDAITTVGNKKCDYLKKINNCKYKDKVYLVTNGFDTDDFKLSLDYSIVEKYNPNCLKIISYVGNVGSAQGLENFVELAKLNPTFLFFICGTGRELNNLSKTILSNNINNIILTGKIDKRQALAVTTSSYISFIPLLSSKMVDSVPTKLFESLALGTPVLLIASGESCDILDECGFGLHSDPENKEEIIMKFSQFLSNYNSIIKNKEKTRKIIVEKYSRKHACSSLEILLK